MFGIPSEVWAPLSRFAVLLGAFPVIYGVFAWVEERTSAEAKRDIALWLRNFGGKTVESAVSLNVRQFHEKLFGQKQFSRTCIHRTLFWSLMSYLIVVVLFVAMGIFSVDWPTGRYEGFFRWFIFINATIDYIGIGVTRFLISKLNTKINLITGSCLLLVDIASKFVTAPAIIFAYAVILYYDVFLLSDSEYDTLSSLVSDIFNWALIFYGDVFSGALLSIAICSMWVWLYFFGLHALRRLHALGLRTMKILVWFLDIEKQPIRSVGVVAAGALTLVYALGALAFGAK